MLHEAMLHFQSVARRFGLIIRVRAANIASLEWLGLGHPPKHVKLKSKSIKPIDFHLGAKKGTEGLVGYFKPSLPGDIDSLPAELAAEIRKRYKMRMAEWADNADDMAALQQKGLITLEGGVVVDTGLSSTRLNAAGQLELLPGSPSAGTGKGFTGDYDMYDIRNADGSVIVTADGQAHKAAAMADLQSGPANVQHGAHRDWKAVTPRDKGIDAAIRGGHLGEPLPDGTVVPRRTVGPDGSERVAEALIEFTPGAPPVASYDMEVPGG